MCGIAGQEPGQVRVEVETDSKPLADVEVIAIGTTRLTDATGLAVFDTPPGTIQVTVVRDGFVPVTVLIEVIAGQPLVVRIELVRQLVVEEEVTVVASTRTDRRIEDQAMRVEVLNREEIQEKVLMTPGDIVMMLNEMGGMRVQTTSLWVANYYSARNPLRLSSLVILGVVARMFRCATRSSCWCT